MTSACEREVRRAGLLAVPAGTVAALWLCRPGAVRVDGSATAAIVTAAAWAAWCLAAYAAVATAAALLAAGRPHRRLGRMLGHVAPPALRRAADVAVGAAVVASVTCLPAAAYAARPHPAASHHSHPPVVLSLDWPTARRGTAGIRPPVVAPPPATAPAPALVNVPAIGRASPAVPPPRNLPGAAVTVRPGDSLWAIAARALGGHATNARIAAAWPQWWAANRSRIGPDPGLIRPGQHLVPPIPADPRSSS